MRTRRGKSAWVRFRRFGNNAERVFRYPVGRAENAAASRPAAAADIAARLHPARVPVPAVLEARPGGPAERLAARLAGKSPALAFIAVLVVGFVGLAALSIAVGLVVMHVLLPLSGVSSADESVVVWLVHHRITDGHRRLACRLDGRRARLVLPDPRRR